MNIVTASLYRLASSTPPQHTRSDRFALSARSRSDARQVARISTASQHYCRLAVVSTPFVGQRPAHHLHHGRRWRVLGFLACQNLCQESFSTARVASLRKRPASCHTRLE